VRTVNLIAAVLLMALAGGVVYVARSFPASQGTLGPAFFPNLMAGVLAAFSAAMLIQALLGGAREPAPTRPGRPLLLVLVCMGLYVFLLPVLGFLVTTPAFLAATGLVLADSIRRWWKAVTVTAILTTGALYILFVHLLNVPLP